MKFVFVTISPNVVISVEYDDGDAIWKLPTEKLERKAIADAQRVLAVEADRRAAIPQTIRG